MKYVDLCRSVTDFLSPAGFCLLLLTIHTLMFLVLLEKRTRERKLSFEHCLIQAKKSSMGDSSRILIRLPPFHNILK